MMGVHPYHQAPEFPGFSTSNYCNQLIFHGNMLFIGEHDCPFASMLCGLLPEFPSAADITRDLRKSRSSPLKHIFSTIPAFTPPSTHNWGCTRSGCPGVVVEKI
jgi:hypothetical protein